MTSLLSDVQRGYERWAAKPHNAKWVRKIDGTPIANDIVINIFEELKDAAPVHADGEAIRIADAVLSWLVTHNLADAGNEYRAEDVIEIMNDLAPSAGGETVKVKPLTWSHRNDQPAYEVCADCPFGRYAIAPAGEYGYGWKQPRVNVWEGFLPTVDEAKAAAQADYERRIRSALAVPATEKEKGNG